MDKYLETFLPDLPEFKAKIEAFDRGEVPPAQYKGFSGGFGSYAQKGYKTHMLRLRLSGGRISKEKLRAIAEICERNGVEMAKLTTCQSVQLHNNPAANVPSMMEEAWKNGMITRGGGGDFPRNVMCSPLAGLEKGEPFNVAPYAKAAGEFLFGFIKGPKFPRKLKVCFSNGLENIPHATFRDLGFVATADKKFDVYAAGGLGNGPSLGVKVAEGVDPSEILYYIKAMVMTFLAHGNYENRGKARTRFMKEKLGEQGFIDAFNGMLEEARKEDLDLTVEDEVVEKRGNGTTASGWNIVEQKQEGLYAVYYHPIAGQVNPSVFRTIYETIKDMDEVEVRLHPESALYVVNLTGDEAQKVQAVLSDGAKTVFETSTCCVGTTTCQGGLGDSPALLRACVEAVRKENFADGVLPKIAISGCPSSCAAHQVAPIGFRGAMKQIPGGKPVPAFAIFVGGSDKTGKERIAEAGKSIAVEDIPKFLVELGKTVSAAGTTYDKWIETNRETLDRIIEQFA